MKITSFIVGIVLAVLVITSFGLIISNVNTEYSITYDPSEIQNFEKMAEIQNLTEDISGRIQNQTVDRTLSDVIGGFIADGKDTLLLSVSSFGIFETMADEGLEKINAPPIFKTSFFTILIVVLMLGVLLSAILGKTL